MQLSFLTLLEKECYRLRFSIVLCPIFCTGLREKEEVPPLSILPPFSENTINSKNTVIVTFPIIEFDDVLFLDVSPA